MRRKYEKEPRLDHDACLFEGIHARSTGEGSVTCGGDRVSLLARRSSQQC